jgi:sugar lactone lactonase YvrE
MRSLLKSLTFASLAIFGANATADTLKPVWEVDGFKMPESVVYDEKRQKIYVSNINGGPLERDGNGSVSVLNADGSNVTVDWVEGLSSPKGMDLFGNKLYVADVGDLVVIDVDSGEITARYPAPSSKVLNGLDVTEDGTVYVSDWLGSKIYVLKDHKLELWLEDAKLNLPNGLFAADGYLYLGTWGQNPKADFTTDTSGTFLRVSLKTKKIETLNAGTPWMNLDGIHKVSKKEFFLTDFIKGELLVMSTKGKIKETHKLASPSAADFFYIKEKNLLIVPYLMGAKIAAYEL